MNWVSIIGSFDFKDSENNIKFLGGVTKKDENNTIDPMGLCICDKTFTSGEISATIYFKSVNEKSLFDIVVYYNPENQQTINVGISQSTGYTIRNFEGGKWNYHGLSSLVTNPLVKEEKYSIKAKVNGSIISLFINNVEVLKANLPFPIPQGQIGFFCISNYEISISNILLTNVKPKVFVVMQYSSPYNDVYYEIIKKLGDKLNLEIVRIDEKIGTGIIIQDIIKAINESHIIIADISPSNPNVFYEVGYAHALKKPTILLAQKETVLPFDVSPFRVIFYENSIGGKRTLEESLENHLIESLK
jgi:hypothetical protein